MGRWSAPADSDNTPIFWMERGAQKTPCLSKQACVKIRTFRDFKGNCKNCTLNFSLVHTCFTHVPTVLFSKFSAVRLKFNGLFAMTTTRTTTQSDRFLKHRVNITLFSFVLLHGARFRHWCLFTFVPFVGSPEDVVDIVMAKVRGHDHRRTSFINCQGCYHRSWRSLIASTVKLVYGKET